MQPELKFEMLALIVSVLLFIFGALFSVVGFLIKQAIVDAKKEVRGLRVDVVGLTQKVSELFKLQSNIEERTKNDHCEILVLRKTQGEHANTIQEIRTIQKRCKTCNT